MGTDVCIPVSRFLSPGRLWSLSSRSKPGTMKSCNIQSVTDTEVTFIYEVGTQEPQHFPKGEFDRVIQAGNASPVLGVSTRPVSAVNMTWLFDLVRYLGK